MKKRLISIVLIFVLVSSILSACSKETLKEAEEANKDGESITVTDDLGREVTIEKNPEKVVILFSSFIDIWVKSGGKLVGMTEDQLVHDVKGLDGVEGVGRTGGLSLEKILSLEPELVILSVGTTEQRELVPILEENNVKVLALEYILKDDYFRIAKLFSEINDSKDLYEENVATVEKQIEEVIERVPDEEIRVFIMFASSKSISARGSDSTLGEMLADLKTINIADEASELLNDKNFSLEKVIEEDPDFIFVQTRGSDMEAVNERIKKDVESNPAWASLSAVKNDRYIMLPKDLYLYKANDRYGEAYENLAKILYPDIFN